MSPQNKALSFGYPQWVLSGYLWPGSLGHLDPALSCWASVSPLCRLLTEVPPALKVPDLRLQRSTTGPTGAPEGKKTGLFVPGPIHHDFHLLLLFPGFLE